jgi:nicotinamide riboside transporter PnuC
MEILQWFFVIVSIIGTVLNVYKNNYCFVLWAITNFFWVGINFYKHEYAQSFLFLIYFILAILGLWQWRKGK